MSSSTNKTDHHDITNIVESGVKHHNPNPMEANHQTTIQLYPNFNLDEKSERMVILMLFYISQSLCDILK
jgi:hypothetical protein